MMRPRYYILDERGEPVRELDMHRAAMWLEESHRIEDAPLGWRVAYSTGEGFHVSTVFLWLDHSHTWDGPPVLWESGVFAGGEMVECERCGGSREQAHAMHDAMVERALACFALAEDVQP